MEKNIIVIAETYNDRILPITYEVIACAESLCGKKEAAVTVIVIHPDPEPLAEELSQKTNHNIIAVKTDCLGHYNSYAYKTIIADTIKRLDASFICVGHTSQGIDYAPGLAVKLECACITSVNGIIKEEKSLAFSRSLFGGKVNAFIKPETKTAVLTVQPGAFKKTTEPEQKGTVTVKNHSVTAQQIESTGFIKPEATPSDLGEAKTVIAIGRGILEPENISLAENFSLLFAGSAIACSRPVVDMGWMKYKYQVGITGAVIAPELYLACGISGSSQHIAGMSRSEFVVSINKDPNAAIFNVSDICIVEDMFPFFEAFKKNVE